MEPKGFEPYKVMQQEVPVLREPQLDPPRLLNPLLHQTIEENEAPFGASHFFGQQLLPW